MAFFRGSHISFSFHRSTGCHLEFRMQMPHIRAAQTRVSAVSDHDHYPKCLHEHGIGSVVPRFCRHRSPVFPENV